MAEKTQNTTPQTTKSTGKNSVSSSPDLPTAMDYAALRSIGLGSIVRLASDHWTDYNESDPGITMLEALAYAITDLGYRTNFPIEDIIAQQQKEEAELGQTQFPQAAEILTSDPVTANDYRRILLDVDGVSNAWVYPDAQIGAFPGVQNVVIQPDHTDLTKAAKSSLIEQVRDQFLANRNLGEDLGEIEVLVPKVFALDLEFEVEKGVQINEVVAEAIFRITQYLAGVIQFLTLPEMQALYNGENDQVFEGPKLKHGFIPESSFQPKIAKVTEKDLIKQVQPIPGILRILRLQIIQPGQKVRPVEVTPPNAIAADNPPVKDRALYLGPLEIPELAPIDQSQIRVLQGETPLTVNVDEAQIELDQLVLNAPASKLGVKNRDIPIPKGNFRNIEHYYSVQYDLPSLYGLKPKSVPKNASDRRKGEVKQLRSFLLMFDQVMANYLAQLAHIGELFSWSPEITQTYFYQGLGRSIHGLNEIMVGFPKEKKLGGAPPTAKQQKEFQLQLQLAYNQYDAKMGRLRESETVFLQRRNRFLTHLLARVGRSLDEYMASLNREANVLGQPFLVETREKLLGNYPALSAAKARGENPLASYFDPDMLSGLKRISEALFGMPVESYENQNYTSRFQLRYTDPTTTGYTGEIVILTEDGTPIDLDYLLKVGQVKEHYRVIQKEKGLISLWIYDDTNDGDPSRIFRVPGNYFSLEDARNHANQLAEMLKRYDLATERVFVLDHILFRPGSDQPVYGLELLNTKGEPAFRSKSWYKGTGLAEIEKLRTGHQANYIIMYGRSGIPSVLAPGRFVFGITAREGDLPYPVYPASGVPLPFPLPENSFVFYPAKVSELFTSYIEHFYSKYLTAPTLLGDDLIRDFLQTDLPSDWRTGHKDNILSNWGIYVLDEIAKHNWSGLLGDATAFGTELQQLINLTIAKPTGTDLAEMAIFLDFVEAYFYQQFPDPTDLGTEFLTLLKPTPVNTASFWGLEKEQYLASVGRELGRGFLENYFNSELDSGQKLGLAVVQDLGLASASEAAEKSLEDLVGNLLKQFIFELYNQKHPVTATDILDAFLGKDVKGILKSNNEILISAGQQFFAGYLMIVWGEHTVNSATESGEAYELGLIVQTLEQKWGTVQSAPTTFSTLADVGADLLANYGLKIYKDATPYNLGKGILEDVLSGPIDPAKGQTGNQKDKNDQFSAAGQTAMSWYIRNVLASGPGSGINPVIEGIDQLLGISDTALSDPFNILVSNGLAYFLDEGYIPAPKTPEALGKLLQEDLELFALPTPGYKFNALAACGAYFLSDFLVEYVEPIKVGTGMSFGDTIFEMMHEFGTNADIYGHFQLSEDGKGPNESKVMLKYINDLSKLPTPTGMSKMESVVEMVFLDFVDGEYPKELAGEEGLKLSTTPHNQFLSKLISIGGHTLQGVQTVLGNLAQKGLNMGLNAILPGLGDLAKSLGLGNEFKKGVKKDAKSAIGGLKSHIESLFESKKKKAELAIAAQAKEHKTQDPGEALTQALTRDLLTAKPVTEIDESLYESFSFAGQLILGAFLKLHFPWQYEDATALGNAVAAMTGFQFAPADQSPTLPVPQPESGPAPMAPVTYQVSLEYSQPESGNLVKLFSTQDFSSLALAEEQIHAIATSIDQVSTGQLAANQVFKTLFKPWEMPGYVTETDPILQNPYSFVNTVLVPKWPTRFQDEGFRSLLEKTLREEAPAHLYVNVLWLDKIEMDQISKLYTRWRDYFQDGSGAELLAEQIMRFIMLKRYPAPELLTSSGDGN